ncbi:hypothetical protein RJ639_006281 [Escallonia herrerae]|uniref:Wall-associated receptor kinase galacturonan-binding domain-containing protein n=1 Tax=Escallonia herrerae TaxID=1293975 RepID=A0AA88VTG8_9ASTE|nr:hypothetical protein RJ639_006281 [Escallonia herrerae]
MLKAFLHVLLFICILPLIAAHESSKCENSCGTSKHFPYPFGFSSGCHIRLNCTENSTIVLDKYPVLSVTPDSILIDLPAQCGRPIEALRSMFSHNYAPTSNNGILLQNCSSPVMGCRIPTTMVLTNFELLDCGNHNNNTLSCYSEDVNKSMFIDYSNVTRTGCRSLLSAITTNPLGNGSAISLDVQVVELGWWLDGESQCSDDAERVTVQSPAEKRPGYRCRCLKGFVGDGYRESLGCRRARVAVKLHQLDFNEIEAFVHYDQLHIINPPAINSLQDAVLQSTCQGIVEEQPELQKRKQAGLHNIMSTSACLLSVKVLPSQVLLLELV